MLLRTHCLFVQIAFANQYLTNVKQLFPILYVQNEPLNFTNPGIKRMFIPKQELLISQYPLERKVACLLVVAHKIVNVGKAVCLIIIDCIHDLGGNHLVT